MAAGVHDARVRTGVGRAGRLGDRQRVHIRAQADRAQAVAAADLADDAVAAQPPRDLIAPAFEETRHQIARAALLEGQFRMAMNVAANRDERLGLGADPFEKVGHYRACPRKGLAKAKDAPRRTSCPCRRYSTSSTTTVRPESRCARDASMNGSRSPSS